MSRRGNREEIYEERGYYTDAPPRLAPPVRLRERDLEQLNISRRDRDDPRRSQPEFMRRQYIPEAEEQPLVLTRREREDWTRTQPRPQSYSPEPERLQTTRLVQREKVREEPSPSPPPVERVRTRVIQRERDYSPPSSPPPERRSGQKVSRVAYERSRERSSEHREARIVERERDRYVPAPRSTRARERSPSLVDEERIQITRTSRRRSPSSESSVSPAPVPEPQIIRAPPIHQEIITHHRHVDHGYEYEPRPAPTPPSPAPQPRAPPPVRERDREIDIDIKTGRGETEIDIYKSSREPESRRRQPRREDVLVEKTRDLRLRENRRELIPNDMDEEEYYARKVDQRAYIGEAYHGATKDWAIVDVPPGTERVRMDGLGGATQEISWQKYNGVRRSKFLPERERQRDTVAIYDKEVDKFERPRQRSNERALKEYEKIEININDDRRVGRPAPPPPPRSPDMWTEVTKDLIVAEAIEELGYEYNETEFFYYIFKFLHYEDVQELVDLSESIKRDRVIRIREIAWERERADREAKEQKKREKYEAEQRERERVRERDRERESRKERDRRRMPAYEDERVIEREIIFDDGRRAGRYEY